jgi:hypothetical protein
MDLHHLRQGLHVIASSWDYRRGAESRASVRGNSVRFTGDWSQSSTLSGWRWKRRGGVLKRRPAARAGVAGGLRCRWGDRYWRG